jgi:hypothetical protein
VHDGVLVVVVPGEVVVGTVVVAVGVVVPTGTGAIVGAM